MHIALQAHKTRVVNVYGKWGFKMNHNMRWVMKLVGLRFAVMPVLPVLFGNNLIIFGRRSPAFQSRFLNQ